MNHSSRIKKKMKNKRGAIPIIIIAIGLLILGIALGIINIGSMIYGAEEIKCNVADATSLSCSSSTRSLQSIDSNKIYFRIGDYPNIKYQEVLIPIWADNVQDVSDFYSSAKVCDTSGDWVYYNGVAFQDKYDKYFKRGENSACGLYYKKSVGFLIAEHFPNQIFVVNGNYVDENQNPIGTFTTYGLCNFITKQCWAYSPEDKGDIQLGKIYIYLEYDGATEQEACAKSGSCSATSTPSATLTEQDENKAVQVVKETSTSFIDTLKALLNKFISFFKQ